jgi:hypothetical protein
MSEKSIAEKLQLKPGKSIHVLNEPSNYLQLLGKLPTNSIIQGAEGSAEIVQLFVNSLLELDKWFLIAVDHLKPDGIFWVSYPKLTSKLRSDINRDSVNDYAKTKGWQGVAIFSIDENWSALRLRPR